MDNTIKKGGKMSLEVKYLIAFCCGLLIGFYIVPDVVTGIIYIALAVICIYHAVSGNPKGLFTFLPYLIYSEIYARSNIHFVAYLFVQFVLLASFTLLIVKQGTSFKLTSRSFIFIFLYSVIEVVDLVRTNEPDFARASITNSLLLFVISFWGATFTVSLSLMNKLLDNLKLAGVYVTGIICTAHARGQVIYRLHSSTAGTNGLAPVQISAYLGVAAILFFLSIVNEHERKNLVTNLILFVISTVYMILSFSRGGVYFLGVVAIMYFIFNWKKAGNYSMLLILIPVGLIIYNFVVSTTNGLIAERYEQEGSSGRDKLVEIGFEIFKSEPLAGIGTGNFSKEIVRRQLFGVESGAHNEFIRAAAEHGILGIITYWGFYISMFIEIMGRRGVARHFSLYFLVLFCLIIVHNGMKISIQPVLLIFVVCVPVVTKLTAKKNVQAFNKQPG